MQVSTPAAPARGRARNNTRLRAFAESCTRCLSRAKRPSAQWCVSPGCKFGPDRNRRLDTGGAAPSATPYGRLKFSPRSRPSRLRKVASEGCCSMGGSHARMSASSAGSQTRCARSVHASLASRLASWADLIVCSRSRSRKRAKSWSTVRSRTSVSRSAIPYRSVNDASRSSESQRRTWGQDRGRGSGPVPSEGPTPCVATFRASGRVHSS